MNSNLVMNSLLYDSIHTQEQSITNLVKIHSLTHLLQEDREQLLTQSYSIFILSSKILIEIKLNNY